MSTAATAADVVRPLSAIKADMANALATKPESIIADIKAAITWLPRKAAAAIMRAARFMHIPQFAAFVRTNFSKFLAVVGKGAFAVEVLTSHWGQKTISTTLKTAAAVTKWAVKWSWKILTSPLRVFGPTHKGLDKIEAGVAKADRKMTPNSGEAFGPLQIAHDVGKEAISPNATHMKLARITAFAVMSVRTTRRFVPVGWLRALTYVLDGAIIANAYNDVIKNTWVGRKLNRQATVIEADIVRQAETVSAEASHMTREAAADTASKLRAEADKVEAEGLQAAREARDEMAAVAVTTADELRSEAASMEKTAERLAAAETAAAVTEVIQENVAAAEDVPSPILVEERPKPGPTVPPMGGRTPSAGPQAQSHQRHGGQKPPKKR